MKHLLTLGWQSLDRTQNDGVTKHQLPALLSLVRKARLGIRRPRPPPPTQLAPRRNVLLISFTSSYWSELYDSTS